MPRVALDHETVRQLVARRQDQQSIWARCVEVARQLGCTSYAVWNIAHAVDYKAHGRASDRVLLNRLSEYRHWLEAHESRAAILRDDIEAITEELNRRGIAPPTGGN